MKRSRGSRHDPTLKFWRIFFSHAAPVLFGDLATLNGTFRPEQRLIVQRVLTDAGETFLPNLIFETHRDVEASFFRNTHRLPVSIEFGGICPANHLSEYRQLKPRQGDRDYAKAGVASWLGELVIDVDLDDGEYNRSGICNCVGLRRCCDVCWTTFMLPAQLVLLYLVERVFKFQKFFLVFSGRRGFHLWILDQRVILWTASQRRVFIEKLAQIPSEETALANDLYQVLEPHVRSNRVLADRCTSRKHVFKELYPKFDMAVTADPTHNHKLPLVLHPSTGFWCVPIESVVDFLPSQHEVQSHQVTQSMMMHYVEFIKSKLQ